MSALTTYRVQVNLAILAMILALSGGAAMAEPPSMVGGASPEQESIYLAGVASGIGYANAHMKLKGQSPLYCAPLDFVLNVDRIRKIAELTITGPVEPGVYTMATVSWLSENYPCEM